MPGVSITLTLKRFSCWRWLFFRSTSVDRDFCQPNHRRWERQSVLTTQHGENSLKQHFQGKTFGILRLRADQFSDKENIRRAPLRMTDAYGNARLRRC